MAAMSNLSLADVLHQAPRVVTFLQHGGSLKVLLTTSTDTRNLVRQYVTHITFPDQSHMPIFAQEQWPILERISFRCVHDLSAVAGPSHRGWQISMRKPTFATLDLDAFEAVRSNTWPWQMLTDLAVYYGQGLPVDLHMLSTCHWPLLETLTLCCGRLDDAQAAVIFWGNWPFLRTPRLPSKCLTDLEGLDHNRWLQLKSVCLKDNPVSNTGLQRLVGAQWPKLVSLSLSNIASAHTWRQLTEANWPMLSSLDLGENRIEATMLKNIAAAQFCCIRKLYLSNTSLDSIAIGHLVKAPCMQLFDLHLTSALCGSVADCLVLLSIGAWPQLNFLWLGANGVDASALPALTKSKWPSLYYVNLSYNRLSHDDFKLVGGGAACVEPRDMCRKLWPKLQFLEF